jgi:hypothetical protein
MAYDVFISYSTRDLPVATRLQEWIAAAGAKPFLAEYSLAPGRPLGADILAAIKNCNLFLLLWSQNAAGSEWVPQEIGVARGASKQIMPLVLQPGLALPGFLKELKYLELYKDPNAAVKWLHGHLVKEVSDHQIGTALAMGVAGAIVFALFAGDRPK